MEINLVRFGQASQTLEVEEGTTLSEVLAHSEIDPESTVRFRGEEMTGDEALPVQAGETILVAPPKVNHG